MKILDWPFYGHPLSLLLCLRHTHPLPYTVSVSRSLTHKKFLTHTLPLTHTVSRNILVKPQPSISPIQLSTLSVLCGLLCLVLQSSASRQESRVQDPCDVMYNFYLFLFNFVSYFLFYDLLFLFHIISFHCTSLFYYLFLFLFFLFIFYYLDQGGHT